VNTEPQLKPTASVEKLAYNTRELCAAIGVSSVTLWRLRQRGLIRPIAGVRHNLFARAEVERFLAGKAA
jgi:Helix-turn-helix domain